MREITTFAPHEPAAPKSDMLFWTEKLSSNVATFLLAPTPWDSRNGTKQ